MAAAGSAGTLFSCESAVATSGSLFGDALRECLPTAGPVVHGCLRGLLSIYDTGVWLRIIVALSLANAKPL